MARIPTVTNEINASALRTNNAVPNTRASGEAFGAGIGRAMGALAGGVDQLGAGVDAYMQKRRQETVANQVAQSDFTRRELEIRQNAPANGAGYQQQVVDEYLAFVDEQADLIDDNIARTEYKNRMLSQLPAISSRSAQFEFTLDETHSKAQANASLNALNNKIMSDPSMFDTYIEQGLAVLDTRTELSATQREAMKLTWQQDSARARFTGMLERATSVEEIDAIAAELVNPEGAEGVTDWTEKFLPADYERLVNQIGTTRNAFVTKADADARAAIETLDQRSQGLTLIPQEELAAVQQLVKQSQNPITIGRMARIMRDQAVIQESQTLTPAELRAQINASNGNPGAAYPGMPPTLSTAINDASSKFDVSASYLGGTIQREYGQFLGGGANAPVNPQFAPVATAGMAPDLRNIRPDVVNAATIAGELFGAPLQINSGYRTQDHQDNIIASGDPNRPSVAKESHHTSGTGMDINTVGMSAADKGRLVGALVDAGFTGIGEYDTHIHGDFRPAVPGSFGVRDGKTWGGWTYLSPEVAQALTDRGFAAGLSAEQIRRAANAVPSVDSVDYGQGTQIVGADGQPASSALGPMQFTEGTFLGVMQTPGVAQRIGVDISGMSEAQILELRKDPYVATLAGAALAEQNKKALQSVLGRPVTDPELYMAHFLGAGGATALITAMRSQPDQSAAALLPEQASANKPVFYKDGKPLTVRELYGNISTQFGTAPSQVAYGDNVTRGKMLDNMETALANDPVAHAQASGTFTLTPLDASVGFQQRGQDARSIADYYGLPVTDMKPFTEDEANSLIKGMKEGSVDDVLEIMTAIQAMGGDVSRAALKQLDQKDSVYAYAAGLQFERNNTAAASDIVRGQKRIEENPAIKDTLGATDRDIADAFTRVTGGALMSADPKQRQAIQDAALAHYVETVFARTGAAQFNEAAFGASVQAVLGGVQGAPAVDRVNGQPTVLPPGIDGPTMEQALDRMTVDDWTRLSAQGEPPRYVTGEIMDPLDLADEAQLRAIGGGAYKVMLSDGTFAVTGNTAQNGRVEAYIFTPDPAKIKQIATRPVAATTDNAGVPIDTSQERQLELWENAWENMDSMSRFDENGRWLGPVGQ